MTSEPREVLANIPGWESADIEPLTGGRMNRVYLVDGKFGMAVLKVDDTPQARPRNSRAEEAQVQSAAHEAGLAGRVLYHDERCYITEYVSGTAWTDADLRDPAKLESLGVALRRLHRIPAPARRFDALTAARGYAASIDSRSATVATHLETIAGVRSRNDVCLCHNDLVAANIVSTPELRFIDWEYACGNDPLFDLATVIVHHGLDESHIDSLMVAYAGRDWQALKARLDEQSRLYTSLLWLWEVATRNS
ncbi:MAG: choline/ethanolamine kinase family protein [Woeseiaceae bacterium]|nr:choline/ethanolamine kinase family protein [Woeseiaceae bacterium]